MRRYWDSSALVDALHDARVEKLAREPDQVTRLHTLAETFSVLTGGRLGFQYVPSDAAALVREITETTEIVELDRRELTQAMDQAEQRGVRGGNIHDWLHAVAAKKAKAAQLLTDIYHLPIVTNLNLQSMPDQWNHRAQKPQSEVQHAICSRHLDGPGAVASSLPWKVPKVGRPIVDNASCARSKPVQPEKLV